MKMEKFNNLQQMINKKTRVFKCLSESCGEEHLKPIKGFPLNKAVNTFLSTPFLKEINRIKTFEALKQDLKNMIRN